VKEQRFEKLKIRCDELNYEADIVSEKRAASQTQVSELMELYVSIIILCLPMHYNTMFCNTIILCTIIL